MSDTTFQHSIPRPGGPTKRVPLPRMSILMNDTMGRRRKDSKNTSKASLPTTPPHSTPKKGPNSSKSGEDLKRRRGTPPVSGEYSELRRQLDTSNLDESLPSTSGSYSHQSSSYTQTSDSPVSDSSYNGRQYSPESLGAEIKQRSVNRSREHSKLNDLGNSNGQKKSGSSNGINSYLGVITFAIIVLGCLAYKVWSQDNETDRSSEAEKLIQNIIELKGLFPSQDEYTWRSFSSGIQDVLMKQHRPAVFLLIASHDETTECLAKRVAELASITLGGTGNVILTPDKLENNISKVHDLMENRLRQTKAVVVSDLLNVQPEAIRAFHDICDEYTPLIAEAVYLFTMRSRIREESGSLTNFVEKELTQKFSAVIKEDTLKALIVRITTGAVLDIREEKNIPCSE